MRRLLPLLVALVVACTANLATELSGFLQTRADAPLEGTVWEHNTGEKYNRYVSFRNGEMSLFYGLVDAGELQRWSDFYSAPYALKGGLIVTELSYPLWGHKEVTESVSVVKSKSAYHIDIDGEDYTYYGPWTDDLDGQWVIFYVAIEDLHENEEEDWDKPSYPWEYTN